MDFFNISTALLKDQIFEDIDQYSEAKTETEANISDKLASFKNKVLHEYPTEKKIKPVQ